MDTTVDAEWEALFNLPADDITFELTALNGPLDNDGFDSPLVFPSGQSSEQSIPGDGQYALQLEDSLQILLDSTAPNDVTNSTPSMPKSGGRFSKEVVKLLRNWLNAHKARPYPTNEEMELLQQRTGLNKTQISNWFANARRRGKLPRAPSSQSSPSTSIRPVDIAPRPDTPAPRCEMRYLNPMERWQSSPPEHEPAAASDIARAVESTGEASLGRLLE
jgi:hypothetical protein